MKKFKRIIALVTVAMFLLSVAAPSAFAADADDAADKVAIGEDVKGTKYEAPAVKLMALDIIKGFEDGTIRPESDVTRAQFAVIVAKMLNLGDVSKSATKFSDVPADHWASGAINLATGRGIIKGYPDGTFKPEQNVTFAEACAMLMQALGYGPALQNGTWPSTPLSLAASEGITKGVRLGANDKTPRGEVLMMAAEALEADIMEQETWGDENNWEQKEDETILSEVWDIDVYDEDDTYKVVDKTPRVALSELDSNELQFANGGATTYEVNPIFNPNDFLGQEVECWIDEDDDYVYYIAPSGDETILYEKIEAVNGDNVELDFSDDDYDMVVGDSDTDGANVWVNIDDAKEYGPDLDSDDLKAYVGTRVKVILNDDDDITGLVIDDLYPPSDDIADVGVVEEVDADDEVIMFIDDTELDLDGDDYAIVKDGLPAELGDLEAGDTINVLKSDETDKADEYFILASSKQVKGEIEKVTYTAEDDWGSYDIFVDGKKYDIVGRKIKIGDTTHYSDDVTYSDDDNETIEEVDDADDLLDMSGAEATLYLDAYGEIAHILVGEAVEGSAGDVAVLTESAEMGGYSDELRFKVVNANGVEVTYEIDPGDVDLNGKEQDATDWIDLLDIGAQTNNVIILELDLNSNGDLKNVDVMSEVDTYVPEDDDYDVQIHAGVNDDDKTITLGNSDYRVTDQTIIWDLTDLYNQISGGTNKTDIDDIDDVETLGWSSIENKDYLDVYYSTTSDKVEYLFVFNADDGDLSAEYNYAIFKMFTKVDGDDAALLIGMDGEEFTVPGVDTADIAGYIYERDDSLAKGKFIRYEIDDEELDVVDILAYKYNYPRAVDLPDSADKARMDIETMQYMKVIKKGSTYVKGYLVSDPYAKTVDTSEEVTYVINSDTVIADIEDTDALKAKGASLSQNDLVLLIDTDDDGKTLDYVVKVAEDYDE